MTNDVEVTTLGDGIRFCTVPTNRFKTCRITVALALPLRKETASANALLPYLLHRTCREYPQPDLLNKRLAELYGARLSADVSKLGENQLLTLSITCIEDRFALDGDTVKNECADLLAKILFDPNLSGGMFTPQDVEREKRLLIDRLDSETNDKRKYALKRCEALMCEREPFGLDRLGTKEAIEALHPEDVTGAYNTMLRSARVQITYVGANDCTQQLRECFKKAFGAIERENIYPCKTLVISSANEVRRFEERLPINQGKLVIGMRAGAAEPDEDAIRTRVMTDIFGGGPYSLLFTNVREKMSLCYYCSARYNTNKGVIFVQSGIEDRNKDKAIEGILQQLADLSDGKLEEKTLAASKAGLTDAYLSIADTPQTLDSWYISQMLREQILTPEAYVNRISEVTAEEISAAAKKVTTDSIYMLTGEEAQ